MTCTLIQNAGCRQALLVDILVLVFNKQITIMTCGLLINIKLFIFTGTNQHAKMPAIPISLSDVKRNKCHIRGNENEPIGEKYENEHTVEKKCSPNNDEKLSPIHPTVEPKPKPISNEHSSIQSQGEENQQHAVDEKENKRVKEIAENADNAANDTITEDDMLSTIMDAINQLSKEQVRKKRITFLDFAGQSSYYAFHQTYLTPETFYILVVDMRFKEDEECGTDAQLGGVFSSWTYLGTCKIHLISINQFF